MQIPPPGPAIRLLLLAVPLAAGACVSYEADPLDSRAIVEALARDRTTPPPTAGAPTLADATGWLAERGPAVREAVAAFRTARARADVPTPWPDPSFEFGPQAAWGDEVDVSRQVTPFATLSVPIPLGGRLGAQDDVNRARAEALRIETVLALRREYLRLRAEWAELAIARARQVVLADIAEVTTRTVEIATRLMQAGGATTLDVALLDLARANVEGARIEAELGAATAEGALATRTGVAASLFGDAAVDGLPALPDAILEAEELRSLLAAHRPDLTTLRARYAVAERSLRLEVEKQYPDLSLNPGFSREPGESRDIFRLGIGLTLPIFDRNQQAIAAADARRQEIRAQYEAAISRALAEIENRSRAVELTGRRRRFLETEILPRAQGNLDLARRAAVAGAADALRLLDAERSRAQLEIDLLAARIEEVLAWTALEFAVGHPLIRFAGEPTATPVPSETLEVVDDDTHRETLLEEAPSEGAPDSEEPTR